MELIFSNQSFGFQLKTWRTEDAKKSREKKDGRLFLSTVKNEIEKRKGKVATKTIENEQTALRSFLIFAGDNLTMADITPERITSYERWMRDKGLKPGTSALYLRSLRAVLNRCGADGTNLFHAVHTGGIKTEKRAIGVEDIMKVVNAELLPESSIERVRDLFLFSLLGMGIPFVDLAFLKKSNVKDGRIEYRRRKTGVNVAIEILPAIQEIIGKYVDQNSPYLFPLLKSTDPSEAEREYRRILGWYNRKLARLSEKIGLRRSLTSYTARHTWASLAYRHGLNLAYISKALGHTNPLTTKAYLKEIDNEDLRNANRQLLKKIGLNYENN